MSVGVARAAQESSGSGECGSRGHSPSTKVAAAAKLPASHFVSVRVTSPAFLERAQAGEHSARGQFLAIVLKEAFAVREALQAEHAGLVRSFVPLDKLHISLAVVAISPDQLPRLIQVIQHLNPGINPHFETRNALIHLHRFSSRKSAA
jgi:hypothetical protein